MQESLSLIRDRFPFAWIELHPDSGNEFINYHLQRWTQQEGIAMTRSEPYKKNDNMCIEERNNTIPRKHLGYVRLDDISFVSLCSEILRIVCLFHNHFKAVRRMVSKSREGSKWKREFEKVAKTPCERVIDCDTIRQEQKDKLKALHDSLNPIVLKKELDTLKRELEKILLHKSEKIAKLP